jgi:hypothetical protein
MKLGDDVGAEAGDEGRRCEAALFRFQAETRSLCWIDASETTEVGDVPPASLILDVERSVYVPLWASDMPNNYCAQLPRLFNPDPLQIVSSSNRCHGASPSNDANAVSLGNSAEFSSFLALTSY